MSEDEVELSDEAAEADSDDGFASDADVAEAAFGTHLDYVGEEDEFADEAAEGDADLSGFADDAGDGASYGFENAYSTGSFDPNDAGERDELIADSNLQDSGEYTLPADALVEEAELADEAASVYPEEMPEVAGDDAGTEFSSEITDALDVQGEFASDEGDFAPAAGEYAQDDADPQGQYASSDEGEFASEAEIPGAGFDPGSPDGYAAEGGEYAAEGGEYAAEGGEYAAEGGEYAAEGGEYAAEGGEYAAEGGEYAAEGEYAPEAEYPAAEGEFEPEVAFDEQPAAAEYAPEAEYEQPAEEYAEEPAEDDDDGHNRPGQIAKSALDDIFARAKKLRDD